MDLFTWGFVAVILVIVGGKWLFERKMYKNSVYKVLYSSFTEYRIRKKTVEGMSESYVLRDTFGGGRMIYQVLNDRQCNPSSFVTIFLESGCYVFGVSVTDKPAKDSLKICKSFFDQNIKKKLADSVYEKKEYPVHFYVVIPDKSSFKEAAHVVKRQNILSVLQNEHTSGEKVFSQEDVKHLFSIVAKEALDNEEENKFATMLLKER